LFKQVATVLGDLLDTVATIGVLLVVCFATVVLPQPARASAPIDDTRTVRPIGQQALPTLRNDEPQRTMLVNDDGGGGAAMTSFEGSTVRTAVRLASS
jgi:hypothetical protein